MAKTAAQVEAALKAMRKALIITLLLGCSAVEPAETRIIDDRCEQWTEKCARHAAETPGRDATHCMLCWGLCDSTRRVAPHRPVWPISYQLGGKAVCCARTDDEHERCRDWVAISLLLELLDEPQLY